ncbi:MAG: NADH-quinone oxidoreductase subunit N [Bacteroidaceae bacterium]|nr:NADH-quinone oxidoreductase subunit N [Bacteroidaceae bacterium]
MNYIEFLHMRPEISLLATFVAIFIYDLVARGKWRHYFHPIVCLILMAHTAVCLGDSHREGELFGGMYYTNPMIGIVKTILTGGTLLLVFQANKWLRSANTTHKQGEFYTLLISTLFGMYIMTSARHFLLFFIGLELASLPLACLVAFDKYRHHSAEAGVKYILSSMFSSAVMIYGISFLYGTTGTLYFADMAANITGSPLQIFALVLFFAGMGFKISLVPFHMWTADTYQGAPTVVSSYLSVISKGAAAFTLMVILMKVFAPMMKQWQIIIYILTVASITIANLFAIRQSDLKRFMAFSSISQAGYIMLAVIGGTKDGMSALVFYVLVYIFANLAVFGVIESLEHHTRSSVSRDDCNGLYKTNPKLTLLMTLALFSLAGIPPFAGFFSKFFVFMSAFKAGFWVLVFIALINTVVSLYYYLLIVKAMYITPNDEPIKYFDSSKYSRISLVICLAGIVLLGICSFIFEEIDKLSFGM